MWVSGQEVGTGNMAPAGTCFLFWLQGSKVLDVAKFLSGAVMEMTVRFFVSLINDRKSSKEPTVRN